jgi:hypothetical protein
MAGGEIGIVKDERETIQDGESVALPDGRMADVVEVYDEDGREGVVATLVVDDGSVPDEFM